MNASNDIQELMKLNRVPHVQHTTGAMAKRLSVCLCSIQGTLVDSLRHGTEAAAVCETCHKPLQENLLLVLTGACESIAYGNSRNWRLLSIEKPEGGRILSSESVTRRNIKRVVPLFRVTFY